MKKKIITTLQVIATIAILWWVLFRDEKKLNGIIHAFKEIDGTGGLWIFAGVLAFGVVEILATLRLQLLLKVQGISMSFIRVLCLVMIGILFNPLMPGGTGGDVIKIFYLLKETPGKTAGALLAVLMDRIIGLLGLIGCTALIMLLRYQWLSSTEVTRNLTWILLVIMGSSLGFIVFSFLITGLGLAHKLPEKMPMRDKLIDLSVAYSAYARAWKTSLAAFVISLGVHVASFYVFYAAARAMRQTLPLLDFFGVMPVINTIAALPISVGGAGLREKLFEDMLTNLFGVPHDIAVATSLTGFSILVFWSIVGGIIYLFYRPTEHARMSEMETTVHNLEHKIATEE